MPFDCTPIIDAPKSLPALAGEILDFRTNSPKADAIIARPIPACMQAGGRSASATRSLSSPGRVLCSPMNSAGAVDLSLVAGWTSLSPSGRCS
jgi:hypothetical protein